MSELAPTLPKLNVVEEGDVPKEKTWSTPFSDFFDKYPIKSAETEESKQKETVVIDDNANAADDVQGADDADAADDTDAAEDDQGAAEDDQGAAEDDQGADDVQGADDDQGADDVQGADDDQGAAEDDQGADKSEPVDEDDSKQSMSQVIEKTLGINTGSSDEETDSDDDDNYLQKFDEDVKKDYLLDFHPESQLHNYEEVKKFATVKRNKSGYIVDPLHLTIPILSKYERTRVLGQRAKQLDSGAKSTVKIQDTTNTGYLMALEELRQKKIPLIIRRPIPNGGFEYWKVRDLELLE